MKRLSLAIGSIATIGIAVKNMENLSLEKVLLYGLVLLLSYFFIRGVWKLGENKQKFVVKYKGEKNKTKSKKKRNKKEKERKPGSRQKRFL